MNIITILFNVCERLFDELIKELLKSRFVILHRIHKGFLDLVEDDYAEP